MEGNWTWHGSAPGGAGKGGIGALDMNKTVEWDGVGGIDMGIA